MSGGTGEKGLALVQQVDAVPAGTRDGSEAA
jgi:hypothetical protein